ncbi:MAG: glycosyltransferase family 2 protein [Gemmatimonadota bacterium]
MGENSPLSIVVPVFNEEENVRPLVDAVRRALADSGEWELLLVDDGSTDGTARIGLELAATDPRVRVLRLARNYGQTTAMQAGFDHVRGDIVISMDGDLQNDPNDIPALVARLEEGFDLVAGFRVHRRDRLMTRRVPSWVANRLIGWITGVAVRDNGCSLKAYRTSVLRRVHLYSDMHRFIPAVAVATAGARISEVPVRHAPRLHGESKYGLSRIWRVLLDLVVLSMIRSFRERPLGLFGIGALGAAVLGAAFFIAMFVDLPLALHTAHGSAVVFSGAALLWLGLAFYLLMLGLIAEVAVDGVRWRARLAR